MLNLLLRSRYHVISVGSDLTLSCRSESSRSTINMVVTAVMIDVVVGLVTITEMQMVAVMIQVSVRYLKRFMVSSPKCWDHYNTLG